MPQRDDRMQAIHIWARRIAARCDQVAVGLAGATGTVPPARRPREVLVTVPGPSDPTAAAVGAVHGAVGAAVEHANLLAGQLATAADAAGIDAGPPSVLPAGPSSPGWRVAVVAWHGWCTTVALELADAVRRAWQDGAEPDDLTAWVMDLRTLATTADNAERPLRQWHGGGPPPAPAECAGRGCHELVAVRGTYCDSCGACGTCGDPSGGRAECGRCRKARQRAAAQPS